VAGAGFWDKVAVLALAFGAGLVADGQGIHCSQYTAMCVVG
jgi:hypothetical protein